MRSVALLIVLLSFLFLSLTFSLAASAADLRPESVPSTRELPIVFEPNVGQAEPGIRFLARTTAYSVMLRSDGADFLVLNQESRALQKVTLDLLKANPNAAAVALDRLPGTSNYYVGRDSRHWHNRIHQYGRVRFLSVLPGTDLIYHTLDGHVEYDFRLAPGADPRALAFRVSGMDSIFLDEAGNLVLNTSGQHLTVHRPVIYQTVNGRRQLVSGRFILREENVVAIEIGVYDRTRTLVVDPVLSYSGLVGGQAAAQPNGIAVDSLGSMYVAGGTSALNYPVVAAFQSTNHGYDDAVVTKLSPNGRTILYSTYLGGSFIDSAASIAVTPTGEAFVTGTTGSTDFPTTPGAFMTTCPGFCNTPFLTKFLADGTLAFSTYMGGSNSPVRSVAVNTTGEAYIAGFTASGDIPTTPGSIQPVFQPGGNNGYVEKLNSAGTGLIYSTYFGVNTVYNTQTIAIAVDAAGSAYVTGTATTVPTLNPIQLGPATGFLAKFAPDGSSLAYSTYLGGSGIDAPAAVAVDLSGGAHVVGNSTSCDFPLFLTSFDTTCINGNYQQKAYALTVNPAGNQIVFSTYLGDGTATGVAVDKAGNTFVTGSTASYSFPVLNPIEATSQRSIGFGSLNSFITEFNPTGKLLFSTYLAGRSGAQASGIAVDTKGAVYVTGSASSDFLLLHPILNQLGSLGGSEIFVAKLLPKKNTPQISLSPRQSPFLSLRNVSSVPLTISAITPSANFILGGDCGVSLPPGTACNLILQGKSDNKTSGTVTITTNAAKAPQRFVIAKSPQGDFINPVVTIVPDTLAFGTVLMGQTSPARTVTITNPGIQPAAVNSIATFSNAFTQTNNCPASLLPGESCAVSVSYTPSQTQEEYGQVAIVHDPIQTDDVIYMRGTGVPSAITPSTKYVQFGKQFVGSPALSRVVNLINSTPYTTSVAGVSVSAGFQQTNNCSTPLLPLQSCRVAVTYQPTTNDTPVGTLTVSGLGPGGDQSVGLYATGLINSDLTFTPMPLEMFSYVGKPPGGAFGTLTNTSSKAITISSFQVKKPFTQTNTCGTQLFAGQSCTVSATFTPKDAGIFSGTVSIQHSGAGSPQVIPLVGTARTVLEIATPLLEFGQQPLNVSLIGFEGLGNGTAQNVVTVSSLTVEGADFTLFKNGCPNRYPRFTGCGDIEIAFTPSQIGSRTGTMTVVADDSPLPHVATLHGIGVSSGLGTLSASNFDFGSQAVGTQSSAQTVALTNTGTGVLNSISISASSQFTANTNCGTSLAVGASCSVSVTFSPTLYGLLAGTMTVQDDGTGSPHTVSLKGIGR